jgi:DNA-binding beta-propeller fold protein YncE
VELKPSPVSPPVWIVLRDVRARTLRSRARPPVTGSPRSRVQLARDALVLVLALALLAAAVASPASAANGFGLLSGSGGCLVAPEAKSAESGTNTCGEGKGLFGAAAVAVSPDGSNVYVASGTAGATAASSFGAIAVLKRDAASGAIAETSCVSSDGTDGRDGASGACTQSSALLGADGVTVSPDGSTVYVTASGSGSVVAFARNQESGALTRLGCFQLTRPIGSACVQSNIFTTAGAILTSAAGNALYVAERKQGAISTLSPQPAEVVAGAATPPAPTLNSLFTATIPTKFFANPCVAVNDLDGACTLGIATQGIEGLVLSPDGQQLYAVAAGSDAVDTFTHDANGVLTETGCLKASPPPGLCGASRLLESPTSLAVSPDGQDVYVGDESEDRGRIDVLARNPTTGALSDASCVESPPEEDSEENEQGEEGEEESPPAPDPCVTVPGLADVSSVAVSGDGSEVYAIGSSSAVVFTRERGSGKLSELSCAASEDKQCTSFPSIEGTGGAAISPDGRDVYVAAPVSNAVFAFGIGATIATAQASASSNGTTRIRIDCPSSVRRACAGRLQLTRAVVAGAARGKHHRRVERILSGTSGRFTIAPGRRALVPVKLSGSLRQLLAARRHVLVMTVMRTAAAAGGSGYGRPLALTLR